ncbi:DUF2512 family protein [Sporosarcina sp. 179-K 3D1 HS]|uniref:DUF2512 family protein n=1 Tax=Sporosarcina sp. 179-K 3D1 HS TaxID=3232169 RepID=UPI0039A19F2E
MNENPRVNHGRSLAIKASLIFPVVWIVLSLIYGVSFFDSTLLGVAVLLVSYVAGDMMILPRMGNGAATFGDLVIGFFLLWIGLLLLGYDNSLGEALLTGSLITLGEYFYHAWLLRTQYTHNHV